MARTDKTRPYLVILEEVGQERHNHRDGTCDLPASPLAGRFIHTRCYWEASNAYYRDHPVCGCSMCTGSYERKQDNRKARHRAQRACRDEQRSY